MKIKKIPDIYKSLTATIGIITLIGTIFMAGHNLLNKNNEILDTLKTTQQMALKSVIWNDAIPLTERANACDVYLSEGYNSLTKKECEIIVNKGAEKGIFSDVRKEG